MRLNNFLPDRLRVGLRKIKVNAQMVRRSRKGERLFHSRGEESVDAREIARELPNIIANFEPVSLPSVTKAPPPPAVGFEGPFPVHFEDSGVTLQVEADQTILEAGLDAGLALLFSCGAGGCGTCMVQLVSGSIEMDEPNGLTDEERAQGQCLACISRPCGPLVIKA